MDCYNLYALYSTQYVLSIRCLESIATYITDDLFVFYPCLLSFVQTLIASVKERLSLNTGTALGSMLLQLFDESDNKICNMDDDSKSLGFYSPMDG